MPNNPINDNPDIKAKCIFWGKFLADGPQCLPLSAHCLDVALVFRALCELDAIRSTLHRSARQTQLSEAQLDRLAVLAMLHDIGKANLGFQKKVFDPGAIRAGHIRELAPLFDFEDESLHASLLEVLPKELETWFSNGEVAYSYFLASFSHHGRPVAFRGEMSGTYWPARKTWWRPDREWDPMKAIAEITHWARTAFPRAFQTDGSPLPDEPRFHHHFAGLVMLADWLGSHPYWFPIRKTSLNERLEHGRNVVPEMLHAVGLDVSTLRPRLAQPASDFKTKFGFSPRPLQAAVDALDPADHHATLVIAESETGSGKTEAALNWFHKLFCAGQVDSLYFALPTRVAARELYHRVQAILERWFPNPDDRPVSVLAAPGYAMANGLSPEKIMPSEDQGNRWQDEADLRRRERQWAAEHPKRFLAATVAVGTIDQALLSSVQTAHAHLRSICLARSLLVVDEVHASDFYMSRLLEFLLKDRLSLGRWTMLLSATLGASARHRYTSLRGAPRQEPPDLATAEAAPYPSITLLDNVTRPTEPVSRQGKRVQFHMLPAALKPESLAEYTLEALKSGAQILVVLNTVDRANSFLQQMESHPEMDPSWLFKLRGVVCPHHGRFAPEDRYVLDRQVGRLFGPESPSKPLLLIGTQTLEQSLDIDADLMISDLVPADVLLQRVGRLHRHNRTRPPGFEVPRCIVLTPEGSLESALNHRGQVAGELKRIGYGSVYEDLRALELTRQALENQPEVEIPKDNRRLVEAATHPEALASLRGDRWDMHRRDLEGGELARAIAAGHATATFQEYFGQFEFNEAGGKVTTRLGGDSLRLPTDRPFGSPFEQTIRHMVIPGHMAPAQPDDVIRVEKVEEGLAMLRCGERSYRYSRYGLEVVN